MTKYRFSHTIIRWVGILFIFSYFPTGFAQLHAQPVCRDTKTKKENNWLVLNLQPTSSPKIYFIKNISSEKIWLNHPQGGSPHASAGWASELQPQHWSALVLSKPKFALSCAMSKENKTMEVDCSKTIQIACEMQMPKTKNSAANYWLMEDSSQQEVFNKASNKVKQ